MDLVADGGRALTTDYETKQRAIESIAVWAVRISPVYLEGALRRAIARTRRPPHDGGDVVAQLSDADPLHGATS